MPTCDEIEDLDKAHLPRLYDKMKELGGTKKMSRNNTIKDKDGVILVQTENTNDRWEEYAGML